ncbi:hypothetical protein TanjilG_32572 [Lupinus angustifolius]|uniref:BZIP domain-containing protein n=1 Tax=Lupinus angustifolius TaxID=3871 RepID=A0A4P1R8B9_LUPAN|nr:hypothetical protein TanjilG_32572 [Lupinus angustifolius]
MGDLAEKRTGCELKEEQSWPKKPTLIKPLPIRASINIPFGASGSSFKPWKRPSSNYIDALDVAKENSIPTKPNSPPAENENKEIMENSNPISDEMVNNGDGAPSGDVDKTDEAQINQLSLECSFKSETDARLKRILSNRLSAQKSRLKKNAHVADLEGKAKYFQDHIGFLYRQMTSQKNRNQLLQIEQHQLKLRMAACVIEKNIAEMERLKELHRRKLAAEAQAGPSRVLNMGASVQLKSNSNLNQPPLGNFL